MDRVWVGAGAGAHGVRGLLRVKSFSAVPSDVASYGPLTSEDGRVTLTLTVTGQAKGVVLCRAAEVADRDRAEALKGMRFYVARDALPEVDDKDDFYHADLIGLRAVLEDGATLGQVTAVHDFGAGDMVEIALASEAGDALLGGKGAQKGRGKGKQTVLIPFTKAAVPRIDLGAGRLVIVPPDGLFGPDPEREQNQERAERGEEGEDKAG